jgi:uncharacterized protein
VDLESLRARVAADHRVADPAHDISHLDRVAALSAWIAERIGADPVQARVASYVHDYHRVAEVRTGVRPLPVPVANDLVRTVLDEHRVPRRWYPDILCAVDATGRYRIAGDSLPADLVEVCPVAAAVHDADNLDALGVVGLARAVSYGSVLGEPLWDPDAALQTGYADGHTSSVLAHCYEKLVHLADEMLTEPGRRLAERRLNDLLSVLGRLRAELAAELVCQPVPGTDWDPRTGYLRMPLPAVPVALPADQVAEPDCRLEFTASVRLGVRAEPQSGGGTPVCHVELCELPAVAKGIFDGSGLLVPSRGCLRIPVRPSVADHVVAGRAAVQVELSHGRPTAITLHLPNRGADWITDELPGRGVDSTRAAAAGRHTARTAPQRDVRARDRAGHP